MRDIFITANFLLQNHWAIELYHEYARDLPIIDYHCHLPPREIAEDRQFENLTRIWLAGDHYKWRAMRAAGVPERFCTGDATDWEKFEKWAQTVPQTLCNPLYHWTHLELKRPLGISDRLLSPATAKGIWDECNATLARDDFSCRGILRQMNVVLVCTTDDPTDLLEFHKAMAADASMQVRVLPTFRPDGAMAIHSPQIFNDWVDRLAKVSRIEIRDDYPQFLNALRQRHDFFHSLGCRLSDHGLESLDAEQFTSWEAMATFARVRRGEEVGPDDVAKFRAGLLYEVALWNHEKGWTQQFHFGALRNNNTRFFRQLGPDTGFDSIADRGLARPLAKFLDRLDCDNRLAKTILYNLNPAQNDMLAAMAGNFQDGTVPGKIQFGSAWWFLDQKDGIERQLNSLANMGLLCHFVGMLTDSRSFLSYTRHEYFRRILCNLLGTQIQQGLLPDDMPLIGAMVQDICYRNAATYFGFDCELPVV